MKQKQIEVDDDIPLGQPSPLNTENNQQYLKQSIVAQYIQDPQQQQQRQQPYMQQQNQQPSQLAQSIYPPQGYIPQPQGYAPQPQGYAPQPQGYAPQPQGFAPQPQGFAPPPQGMGPPQGYVPYAPQGYAPQPLYYPQQSGYYPSQSMQYPTPMMPQSNVQVVMIGGQQAQQQQVIVQLPKCGYCGSTAGQYCSMEIGEKAWCWCFWLTLLCFPCCFWPFIMDECKTPVSRCRSCQR